MGWSLEQLEQELAAHYGDSAPSPTTAPPPNLFHPPPSSAASLVVSHQGQQQQSQPSASSFDTTTSPPVSQISATTTADAWSRSLEQFTALSLQDDFLAADSARKARTAPTTTTTNVNTALVQQAEEYNLMEPVVTAPYTAPAKPPGMPSPQDTKRTTAATSFHEAAQTQGILPQDDAAAAAALPKVALADRPVPPTPQNSRVTERSVPLTPQNSTVEEREEMTRPTPSQPPMSMVSPPQHGMAVATPLVAQPILSSPPMQQQQQAWTTLPPPPSPHGGLPWQQAPPPRQVRVQYYCNAHPRAPFIPATNLESTFMKARDVTYVLHAMLKPILMLGASLNDYDIMLYRKRQVQSTPMQSTLQKQPLAYNKEMTSRQAKTKEWQSTNSTLGHVTKTHVTRPRALLATSITSNLKENNKDRAVLWKARLVVDQAYQAYQALVECWQEVTGAANETDRTRASAAIQSPLKRLLRCCGVTKVAPETYELTKGDSLQLLTKLPKGQTLLSRVLEQALLPPNAVQILLPMLLKVSFFSCAVNSMEEARIFRALANVIATLPQIKGACLLECLGEIKSAGREAFLASTVRMESVHALLRRGQAVQEGNADSSFVQQWSLAEADLMSLLCWASGHQSYERVNTF